MMVVRLRIGSKWGEQITELLFRGEGVKSKRLLTKKKNRERR